jgi:hypothetical protein
VASLRLFASAREAAGIGRDEIENTAGVSAVVNESVQGVPQRGQVQLFDLRNSVTRNTAFVNASLGLLAARIVGELGWSAAGDKDPTTNTFGGRAANEGYRFGSLGLTVRF